MASSSDNEAPLSSSSTAAGAPASDGLQDGAMASIGDNEAPSSPSSTEAGAPASNGLQEARDGAEGREVIDPAASIDQPKGKGTTEVKPSSTAGDAQADPDAGEDSNSEKGLFPHINQLHHLVKELPYFPHAPEVLQYLGTVKLHGTHGDISRSKADPELAFWSRNRRLTDTSDNSGFLKIMGWGDRRKRLEQLFDRVAALADGPPVDEIAISGEWCGKGIQRGVGICEVAEKFFVIFDVRVDGVWQDMRAPGFAELRDEEARVFNIRQFPEFSVKIRKDDALASRAEIFAAVQEVETSCPVARFFGAEGPGEGIVWKCVEEGCQSSRLWFKAKGEAHNTVARDPKVRDRYAGAKGKVLEVADAFVSSCLTEARLQQGLEYVAEFDIPLVKESGFKFVQWVVEDMLREEGGDLAGKEYVTAVRKEASRKAFSWYNKELS